MHIYKSATVDANGQKVIVRQAWRHGNERVPRQVARIVIAAKSWMWLAMPQVLGGGVKSDFAKKCFRHCFRMEPEQKACWTVFENLKKIRAGLSSDTLAIKVRKEDKYVLGHVRLDGGRYELVNGEIEYVDGRPVGEIHLDMKAVFLPLDYSPWLLIHEAGHKFAGVHDYEYVIGPPHFEYYKELNSEAALENADSYAMFVCFLANPTVAGACKDIR